jgi:hypothetical protein
MYGFWSIHGLFHPVTNGQDSGRKWYPRTMFFHRAKPHLFQTSGSIDQRSKIENISKDSHSIVSCRITMEAAAKNRMQRN